MRTRESYQRKQIQERQEIIVPISCPRFMARQALDPEMFCLKIQLQAPPCDPQKQSHSVVSCCKNPKEESSWKGDTSSLWKSIQQGNRAERDSCPGRLSSPACRSMSITPPNSRRPCRCPLTHHTHVRTQRSSIFLQFSGGKFRPQQCVLHRLIQIFPLSFMVIIYLLDYNKNTQRLSCLAWHMIDSQEILDECVGGWMDDWMRTEK